MWGDGGRKEGEEAERGSAQCQEYNSAPRRFSRRRRRLSRCRRRRPTACPALRPDGPGGRGPRAGAEALGAAPADPVAGRGAGGGGGEEIRGQVRGRGEKKASGSGGGYHPYPTRQARCRARVWSREGAATELREGRRR